VNRVQELEIELRRLEDENARLKKMLAKIYGIASAGFVRRPPASGRTGRPVGTTRWGEAEFVKTLFEEYEALPPGQRSRDEVAEAMKISRRTLHRYLDRWAIPWPPVQSETLEDVLDRLRQEQQRRPPGGGPTALAPQLNGEIRELRLARAGCGDEV